LSNRITGILLAAGEARRMGYPKPLLPIGTRTYLAHTADVMLSAMDSVIVVVGAHRERVRAAVPRHARVMIVENPRYERGQLSSLKAALALVPADTDAVIVHLADHPTVTLETFRGVIHEYARTGQPVVIARYQGRRGHPVLFGRTLFKELMAASEDLGARMVVNADTTRVAYLDVTDPGVVLDLDSPDDVIRAGLAPPPKDS
jgi:molybdenum cofactor cytidylyltransferase